MSASRYVTNRIYSNRHTFGDYMKIRQNCRNSECLAKNSMISIVTKTNYSTKKIIKSDYGVTESKKIYRTHKTHSAFYICKECTSMSDFRLKTIRENGIFRIALVSKSYITKVKKLKSKKNPTCVFYNQSRHPVNSQDGTNNDSIIRLFIGSTNAYLGYYCKVCRLAYVIPSSPIKWQNELAQKTMGREIIHILNPPKFSKDGNILVNNIILKTTTGHSPTSDFSESLNNFQQVNVMIPQNKIKKFKKWLEKNDCNIA